MKDTERIRDSIWKNLVRDALERGERSVCFSWETVRGTVTALGLIDSAHQAQLQGALENWSEEGINVKWLGERDSQCKSLHYVITVDVDSLRTSRRS
ncbi:MAG: hypothetical protein OXQ89_13550 [Rhodospirillaceae bacterium]|nr:hypothetical protein [Rhodospirillaceae bacterium]